MTVTWFRMSGLLPDERSVHKLSFFSEDANTTNSSPENNFTLKQTFTFNFDPINDYWSITLSIFIWMAVSYFVVYLTAAIIAGIFMRKHPYVVPFTILMSVMCIVGPATVGAITAMVMGFTLCASNKSISQWHCCVLGIIQTVLLLVVSFSRLLGTL